MPETTASPAHPRTDALNAARETRSREKRQAVEGAIRQLREARQAVTFVAVARLAKVSRQYLYNNFSDEISDQRSTSRAAVEIVEGVAVPSRTPEEYRHVEDRAPIRWPGSAGHLWKTEHRRRAQPSRRLRARRAWMP